MRTVKTKGTKTTKRKTAPTTAARARPAVAAQPFRSIPYMGVIFVVAEAMKLGFWNGHPEWCNLGQGQPEVGPMKGAPPRIQELTLTPGDHAYGPLGGTQELRQAIADHYNRLYRQGKRSRYTADHVSVAAGGRLLLSRVFAAFDRINVGYQVPDYTAYEDLIDYQGGRITPVHLMATPENGFRVPARDFEREVAGHGLGAMVLSNPCNPTGAVIRGEELAAYVDTARRHACLLVMDEFYSHFVFDGPGKPAAGPISAAAHVDDVDRDPVLLLDGLTKCFRYPGWRLGWAVGPPDLVAILGRAASAIDGGPSQVVQRAALQVLEPARADQETKALRSVFSRKRDLMVTSLTAMGIRPTPEPDGTFYTWASIADLPLPINDGMSFFRAALEHKVMTVPGEFFDVNPGKRRRGPSPLRQHVRFSFGPSEDNVRVGLERLGKMIARAR